MASLEDIAIGAMINLLSALSFLLAFAILRLQPINDRVYFPKWYMKGTRASPRSSGIIENKFVNLNFKTYLTFWNWMPAAFTMPEAELIDHAGLDSAIYVRIYLLGLKIFCPVSILVFSVLVPINITGKSLQRKSDLLYSNIDKLSISNIPSGSLRFIGHILMAYVVSGWTWYILYKEYKIVSAMRLQFLSSEQRRQDQFTVLVRNIPSDDNETVSKQVEEFFSITHHDHYLTHQVVYNATKLNRFNSERKKSENWLTYYQAKYERYPKKKPMAKTSCWGYCGTSVDAIDFYTDEIHDLSKKEEEERERVMTDPKAIVQAAFVSFKSRWGAAVCAQTQQTSNPTVWLTEWAPEPRDVHWDNLAIPYVSLNIRRLLMSIALFFLTFFFMIPIAFVQSLASIEGIEKVAPFLRPVIQYDMIKGFIQGFLPGIVLKLFLMVLPSILMFMSKVEGLTSLSSLERRSAGKYYLFQLVNVFLGSIITGAAFEQLHAFLNKSPSEIPRTIGVAIPMKASFFITYVMVDGWSAVAGEILRLKPLIMYHLKSAFVAKTEEDKQAAMDPGSFGFAESEPQIQLYFLLGLVYAVVTPVLLPFIIVFFAFSYMVYRHQVINVYDQKYESGATFWPDVHFRIIIALIIAQLLLLGLLSTKGAARSTPLLLFLVILTIYFHRFCKGRFDTAFSAFPLHNAMVKDNWERAKEPGFDMKRYLQDAYIHPVLLDSLKMQAVSDDEDSKSDDSSKKPDHIGANAVEFMGDAWNLIEDKILDDEDEEDNIDLEDVVEILQ